MSDLLELFEKKIPLYLQFNSIKETHKTDKQNKSNFRKVLFTVWIYINSKI